MPPESPGLGWAGLGRAGWARLRLGWAGSEELKTALLASIYKSPLSIIYNLHVPEKGIDNLAVSS
eukprot:8226208-Heterocapsa_arctica.AAC.1